MKTLDTSRKAVADIKEEISNVPDENDGLQLKQHRARASAIADQLDQALATLQKLMS